MMRALSAAMHSRVSGVSDYLAEDELDGLRIAREIIEHLEPVEEKPGYRKAKPSIKSPLYNNEELLGIVPPDIKNL